MLENLACSFEQSSSPSSSDSTDPTCLSTSNNNVSTVDSIKDNNNLLNHHHHHHHHLLTKCTSLTIREWQITIKEWKVPKLYKITEVPEHLRFNPFVTNGYRFYKLSFWQSIYSLFYLHNETLNILTHGAPFIYFLLFMPRHIPWDLIDYHFLAYLHITGCVAPWLGSCVYHTFMNHRSGVDLYQKLLKWDVIGIWITQSLGASTTIYTSLILYPFWLQFIFIFLYSLIAIRALQHTLLASGVWKRRLGFAILVGMRVLAFILRLNAIEIGQASPLIHTIMQEIWPIIGALISAARIPERWYPGYFDLALNSHNLLHIFAVIGAIHMHLATCSDLIWLSNISKLHTHN